MALIGFNFTKISVEKKKQVKGKINITNNIEFKNITEAKINFMDKDALNIEFEFTCKFEPDLGIIELKGNSIELLSPEATKEVLDTWKKDKVLAKSVASKILNTILHKCNIESVVLSNSMNLPSPIPLPKINMDNKTIKPKK